MPLNSKDSYMSVPYEIIIVSVYLLAATPVRKLLHAYNASHAYKLCLILLCVPIAFCRYYFQESIGYSFQVKVEPGMLFDIYVPIMIFLASVELDLHMLQKCWHQIIVVCLFRTTFEAIALGMLMGRVIEASWSTHDDVMFGFIILPISQMTHKQLFLEVGKLKHVVILLEMEVIFSLIFTQAIVCTNVYADAILVDWGTYLVMVVLRYLVCGALFGIAFGKCAAFILSFFHNDSFTATLWTLGITFFSYQLAENVLHISGALSVLVIGIFINTERSKLSVEVDQAVMQFWGGAYFVVDTVSLMFIVSLSMERFVLMILPWSYYLLLITLACGIVIRLTSFLIFLPILSRIGYGLSLRAAIAMSLAVNKDTVNLFEANILLHYAKLRHIGVYCVTHGLFYVIVLHLFTNVTLHFIFKLLGLGDISKTRRSNMDMCIKHLIDKRDRYLSTLKNNRYISDANWCIVNNLTNIKHPYGGVEAVTADDEWLLFRKTQCPLCKKIFYVELNEREQEQQLRENYVKILKIARIHYIRQFEQGLLTKDAIRYLVQAVDSAIDSPKLTGFNIEELFKSLHKQVLANFVKKCISKYYKKCRNQGREPRKKYRRIMYHFVSSLAFEIFLYLVITLSWVPVLYEILVMPTDLLTVTLIFLVNLFVVIVYWMEIICKILAYSFVYIVADGFKKYFGSAWNCIDFVIVFIATVDTVLSFYSFYVNLDFESNIVLLGRYIQLFRLLRLISIFRGLVPNVLHCIESRIEARLSLCFDIGKAMLIVLKLLMDQLDQIIVDRAMHEEIRQDLESQKEEVNQALLRIVRDRPGIAMSVKTKQCTRALLNKLTICVGDLRQRGYIDNIEYNKLLGSINDNFKMIKQNSRITPSLPRIVFQNVLWMQNDQEVIEYLYSRADITVFEKNQVVFAEGDKGRGVYIILEGVLTATYISKGDSSFDFDDNVGQLPVIDYLDKIGLDGKMEINLIRGNSFGELAVLTGRPYESKIVTDTVCKAYLISEAVLTAAMDIFSDSVYGLRAKLWKYSTVNTVIATLSEIPIYQLMSLEEIRAKLIHSFVPELSNYRSFTVLYMMEDIVLIEGKLIDYNTRELFVGPCYIPRTVRKLTFDDDDANSVGGMFIQAKLCVIPMLDYTAYEIMQKEEQVSELVDMFSTSTIANNTVVQEKMRLHKKTVSKYHHAKSNTRKLFGGLRSEIKRTIVQHVGKKK